MNNSPAWAIFVSEICCPLALILLRKCFTCSRTSDFKEFCSITVSCSFDQPVSYLNIETNSPAWAIFISDMFWEDDYQAISGCFPWKHLTGDVCTCSTCICEEIMAVLIESQGWELGLGKSALSNRNPHVFLLCLELLIITSTFFNHLKCQNQENFLCSSRFLTNMYEEKEEVYLKILEISLWTE